MNDLLKPAEVIRSGDIEYALNAAFVRKPVALTKEQVRSCLMVTNFLIVHSRGETSRAKALKARKRSTTTLKTMIRHVGKYARELPIYDLPGEDDPHLCALTKAKLALEEAAKCLSFVATKFNDLDEGPATAWHDWVRVLADLWAEANMNPSGQESSPFFRFVTALNERLPRDVRHERGLSSAVRRALK